MPDLVLSKPQHDFVAEEAAPIVAFSAGYGCGKTTAAVAKACMLGALNWPAAGMVIEPTYRMIADVFVPTFEERFAQWGVPYHWHKTDHVLTIGPNTTTPVTVFCRSGDEPKRLVGINLGWAIIDEFELQDEWVAKQVRARIRDPRAARPQLALVGTAEGFGWGYTWIEERPEAGTVVVRARTRDNPWLPAHYEQGMRARLTEGEAAMYLDGQRTKREGRVYSRFDRKQHLVDCHDIRGEHVIGADFNVRKMAWCFATKQGERLHIWGEIVREDTDTMAQADEAKRLLAIEYSRAYGREITPLEAARMTTLVCDAAGASASTSSKHSDVALLIAAGFKVKHLASNPYIDDRVTAVNVKLANRTLLVDERAKYVARCLEQQGWAKDGKPEKDKDPKKGLDHGADATGYLVFWFWPAWKPKPNANESRGQRHADGSWR